jgi:Uma2 family endonuclease
MTRRTSASARGRGGAPTRSAPGEMHARLDQDRGTLAWRQRGVMFRHRSLRDARAELLDRPEPIGEPAYELQADGSLTQKTAARPRHSVMQEELLFRFRAARSRRLAQAYPELRIVWPDENVPPSVPDIVIYRWARRPIGPDGQLADEATEPPDVAIEIVSPGQAPAQVGAHCAEYVERGVGWALMIDPERRTAHLYGTGADPLVAPLGARRSLGAGRFVGRSAHTGGVVRRTHPRVVTEGYSPVVVRPLRRRGLAARGRHHRGWRRIPVRSVLLPR